MGMTDTNPMRRWFHRFRSPPKLYAAVDPDGFSVLVNGKAEHRINWSEVQAIHAFKLDCLTFDSIRIAFRRRDGTTLEIGEDIDGFAAVKEATEQRFGIEQEWYCATAFPAFATNLTQLWPPSGS